LAWLFGTLVQSDPKTLSAGQTQETNQQFHTTRSFLTQTPLPGEKEHSPQNRQNKSETKLDKFCLDYQLSMF
jgi:hypothetical protein